MTEATEDRPVPETPLAGLYGFVRSHLLVANNLALAAATLAATLDFLAPGLPAAPVAVYASVAGLVLWMAAARAAPRWTSKPMASLYGFVASHLVVANHIVLAAATLAGALRVLAPRLSAAPLAIYAAAAALLLLMAAAGIAPALAPKLISGAGPRARSGVGAWRGLRRRSAMALLLGASISCMASAARADKGEPPAAPIFSGAEALARARRG